MKSCLQDYFSFPFSAFIISELFTASSRVITVIITKEGIYG
jgi:hypothetical protein